MRSFFLVMLLAAASGLTGWLVSEKMNPEAPAARPERHYIYGFGPHGSPRAFGDYLDEVASEGLREIRWNHRQYGDPRYAGAMSAYATTSGTSTNTILVTTTLPSQASVTCSVPSAIWLVGYQH